MRKKGIITALVLALCLGVMSFSASATSEAQSAADVCVDLAFGLDASGSAVSMSPAVLADYGSGKVYVEVDAELIMDGDPASYVVYSGSGEYEMEYVTTYSDLDIAEFRILDQGLADSLPGATYPYQGETVYMAHYNMDTDEVELAELMISYDDPEVSDDYARFSLDTLGVKYSVNLPAALLNEYGQLAGYVDPNGVGFTFGYDPDRFLVPGGTSDPGDTPSQPSEPAITDEPEEPGVPDVPAAPSTSGDTEDDEDEDKDSGRTSGRDTKDEEDDSKDFMDYLPYILGGAGVLIVAVVIVVVISSSKKKKAAQASQSSGFQQGGYDQGGYQQGGYQQGGYDQGGYQQNGYQQGGYQGGYDQTAGYGQGGQSGGYQQGGCDQGGYQGGFDQTVGFAGGVTAPVSDATVPPSPAQRTTLVLCGQGGEMDGRRYTLTQATTTIGRDPSCHIVYSPNSSGVSRKHCSVLWNNGVLMLMDNGSSNGTFLRGTGKLTPMTPVALKNGDVFFLGEKNNAFQVSFE